MNSMPLALIAAMMPEPLSSILSSGSFNKSASMRDPRQKDADAVDIGIDT
jgi:hypothetical protein